MRIAIVLALLLAVASAGAQTVHDTFSLVAPALGNISYSFVDTNSSNFTHIWPVSCSAPAANVSACAVTRTLSSGETFVRQDSACDLHITAPTCQNPNVPNVSHTVRWRIKSEGTSINITNMNSDDSRSFPKDGNNFNYETEFNVQCPQVDTDEECAEEEEMNITDRQFENYCLRPFGTYGDTLMKLNEHYTDQVSRLQEKTGSLSESNQHLAASEGECKAQLQAEREKLATLDSVRASLTSCQSQVESLESKSWKGAVLTWHLIIDAIALVAGIMAWSARYAMKDHGGD